MSESKAQFLSEFKVDAEYERYVKAWTAYYDAADAIDGHIPPGHPSQARLGKEAVEAGKAAMAIYVPHEHIWAAIKGNDIVTHNKWQQAKSEAQRRRRS